MTLQLAEEWIGTKPSEAVWIAQESAIDRSQMSEKRWCAKVSQLCIQSFSGKRPGPSTRKQTWMA